ncbi:MAG: hypothetical protein HY394_00295 [Candidatus Diapherotrites archaeon]|nr:hypothetical protein [Candidatus Diapherotrites archaeon]
MHWLPEKVSREAAIESVRRVFLAKGWDKAHFSVSEAVLSRPEFVFFVFDAFLETQTAKGKIVSDTMRNDMALSLPSLSVDNNAAVSIRSDYSSLSARKLERLPAGLEGFDEKKLERLCVLKAAAELGVEERNVIVSSVKIVSIPYWSVGASLPGGGLDADVSAFSGKILSGFSVPDRPVGVVESASETIAGLSSPQGLAEHASEFFDEAVLVVSGKKSLESAFGKEFFPVLLAIVAAVLFVAFFVLGL